MAQFQIRNNLVRYHFLFETNTETDFDIVLMAPHDTKQACRKRVKFLLIYLANEEECGCK